MIVKIIEEFLGDLQGLVDIVIGKPENSNRNKNRKERK